MKELKSTKNLAKDTEKPTEKLYALSSGLRQAIVDALLTGTPRNLSVGQVNRVCNALGELPEAK